MINQPDIQKSLLDYSRMNPDKKAIVCNDQSVSYSEFWDIVVSLTEKLKQFDIGKGDFVAVHMSNSIDMVISIFAILNCNAVVIPINIDLPHEQITRILTESNPKMILYNDYAHPEIKYESILTYCVNYVELSKNTQSENDLIIYDPKDLAYCIFTSGSSGIPKGVLLTYEGIINHIEAKISLLNLTCESRLCLSFNIGFVASIWQILTPLLLGAQLFIYDNTLIKKPYLFFKNLERDEINVVSMIPHSLYGYFQYIGDKHPKLALSSMKRIILTGEKVDKVVAKRVYKEYDHISLINAYGQSECSDDTFHYEIPKNLIAGEIPIGKPIQNISYRILNENLEEVPDEEKGELYIGGICLSQCYLNNEQLTRDKFVTISGSTYYRTGDIVKQNKNKDVVCLGRADNQIKIRGYRVEPEEVEAHLNQFSSVKLSVVVPLELNKRNTVLGAFYTSENGLDSNDIFTFLSSKLPPYMVPSIYVRLGSIPQTSNGKINRSQVVMLYKKMCEIKQTHGIEDEPHVFCNLSIKDEIVDVIIKNADNYGNITHQSDLFALGLDSITFIKIVVALEEKFDFEFDDEMLLITNFPTVKSIVDYVESKMANCETT